MTGDGAVGMWFEEGGSAEALRDFGCAYSEG